VWGKGHSSLIIKKNRGKEGGEGGDGGKGRVLTFITLKYP